MRFLAALALVVSLSGLACADVWINEFHYDDTNDPINDFVEIAISPASQSTPLSDIAITFYAPDGTSYLTQSIDTILVSPVYPLDHPQAPGYQFASTKNQGISILNGAGGFALSVSGSLVPGQFISYGGPFTALDGVAAGHLSFDTGFTENSSTNGIGSIRLTGQGWEYSDFDWTQLHMGSTHTGPNIGQTFGDPIHVAVPEASQLAMFGLVVCLMACVVGYRRLQN